MNTVRFPSSRPQTRWSALAPALLLLALSANLAAGQHVKLIATPDDGIQPRAAVDSKGAVHLIYFKGDPKGGDIFYVSPRTRREKVFQTMAVNTQPHTAMALALFAALNSQSAKMDASTWPGMVWAEGVRSIPTPAMVTTIGSRHPQ